MKINITTAATENSMKEKLAQLLGGPWPSIIPAQLGLDLNKPLLSQFKVVQETKQYTIYKIAINSWHLDFVNSAAKEEKYTLNKLNGYLVVPKATVLLHGLIARHQSKWQYQYGASEVVGLAGDGKDPLQNLTAFAVQHHCAMICTDSPGYGEHFLCQNRDAVDLAQVESGYDRLLHCYDKCYLWQVINDIKANVALLNLLAQHNIVAKDYYYGIGHSMGAQQLLAAAPYVDELSTIFVNDGFTTMKYLAEMFDKVLHGPSLMIPNIMTLGDNLAILVANIESKKKVFLSFGAEDKSSPPHIAKVLLDKLGQQYNNVSIELLVHPGGHHLTPQALEWFGREIH